jgi:hypothetical protein
VSSDERSSVRNGSFGTFGERPRVERGERRRKSGREAARDRVGVLYLNAVDQRTDRHIAAGTDFVRLKIESAWP